MKSQEARAIRLITPHFPPRQAACRGAKDERIRELDRGLRTYAEGHPRASQFMLDPSSAYDAVWQDTGHGAYGRAWRSYDTSLN